MRPPKFFVRTIEALLYMLGFKSAITIENYTKGEIDSYYPVGSPEWFDWLNWKSTRMITIVEKGPYDYDEICEARKDKAGNWYITAELHGQHYQVYIGPSEKMTAENIIGAVEELYKLPYQKR